MEPSPIQPAGRDEGEESLIRAIREGDSRALPELIRLSERWVRGVIYAVLGRAEEVDDVAQQVWLAAWRRLFTGDALDDPARWRGWLYRLAHNAAVEAGRRCTRRKRLWRRLTRLFTAGHVSARPADRGAMESDEHRRALQALGAMPAPYREPFVLRHLEGWSYEEIADVLEIPVDTVGTRLGRARQMLRRRLEEDES